MEVSAAIIINEKGEFLMGQRLTGDETCSNLWEFPGGKRQRAESLEKCAIRECQEELGVDIAIDECYHVARYNYPEGIVELVFFLAHITGGELEKRVHQELRWIAPEDLDSVPCCPGDESLIARLKIEQPKLG